MEDEGIEMDDGINLPQDEFGLSLPVRERPLYREMLEWVQLINSIKPATRSLAQQQRDMLAVLKQYKRDHTEDHARALAEAVSAVVEDIRHNRVGSTENQS